MSHVRVDQLSVVPIGSDSSVLVESNGVTGRATVADVRGTLTLNRKLTLADLDPSLTHEIENAVRGGAAATAAAASERDAEQAAARAQAAYASLAGLWLGGHATDPVSGVDGGPLKDGAGYYNTTSGELRFWSAGHGRWMTQVAPYREVSADGTVIEGPITTFMFDCTDGQTVFTGADARGHTLAYQADLQSDAVAVSLDGFALVNNIDYVATDGSTLTLTQPALAGQQLVVVAMGPFTVAHLSGADILDGSIGLNALQRGADIGTALDMDIPTLKARAAVPGPKGDKGDVGPTGPQGAQGPIGLQGPRGPIGPAGPQGERGIQGERGPQGATGATGSRGPVGPQGATGPKGDTGAQGPKGETGAQGPQGLKGDKGDSFNVDDSGTLAQRAAHDAEAEGYTYVATDEGRIFFKLSSASGNWSAGMPFGRGEQGPQGIQGARGPVGPQGATGPQGPRGDVGPQGIQGDRGPTGPVGPAGPQGEQGPQGSTGPKGDTGATGPTGQQGVQGAQGVQGPQGFGVVVKATDDEALAHSTANPGDMAVVL